MRRRTITRIAGALLILSCASSTFLLRFVDRLRTNATLEGTIYISSPKLLKHLSLGYEGLLADVYWTRAVQYFGEQHHIGGSDYKLLWPLLHITTQLDPQLAPAYEFGSAFLTVPPPQGAGEPERAIELVEYGVRNNPDDWHLYYDLGFIYYDQKNYAAAADAFDRGSKVPNAHPFLKIMAAQAAQHGGEVRTSQMLWESVYETTHDSYIRDNAKSHLVSLTADLQSEELERIAAAYRQRTGRNPASFVDLVRAGMLRGIPLDPTGTAYQLDDQGHVFVSQPADFPYSEKALPAGYVPRKH
ncbi:MAG TPA: tetratricopeptide repeat protein [Terriglobales bacterium]|nr:tetratricopeptide repeat protein [Terriglobales bacterium]